MKYKCQCCDKEVTNDEERDRGEWCLVCFPLTRSMAFMMDFEKPCYGDCRERYKNTGDE